MDHLRHEMAALVEEFLVGQHGPLVRKSVPFFLPNAAGFFNVLVGNLLRPVNRGRLV